jgi:hypothetical protein
MFPPLAERASFCAIGNYNTEVADLPTCLRGRPRALQVVCHILFSYLLLSRRASEGRWPSRSPIIRLSAGCLREKEESLLSLARAAPATRRCRWGQSAMMIW